MYLARQITNDIETEHLHTEKYWHDMRQFIKTSEWNYFVVYEIVGDHRKIVTQKVPNPLYRNDKVTRSPRMENLHLYTFQKL